ncbi:MAG TPA: hypothetical protein VID19_10205 [Candidatus Eremiobacteraceae bacterium]
MEHRQIQERQLEVKHLQCDYGVGPTDVWAVGATDDANATPHLTLIEKFHC